MEVRFIDGSDEWIHTLYELNGFVPRVGEYVTPQSGRCRKVSKITTNLEWRVIFVYLGED